MNTRAAGEALACDTAAAWKKENARLQAELDKAIEERNAETVDADGWHDKYRQAQAELDATKDALALMGDALTAAKAEAAAVMKLPGIPPHSPLGPDGYPADIVDLARDCGFAWPDSEDGRREVLVGIARVVRWWRSQYAIMWHAEEKESRYKHFQARNVALAKKLSAVRRAAKQYMVGQRYAHFEALEAELAAAKEAFLKYGWHAPGCRYGTSGKPDNECDCDCGYVAAVAAAESNYGNVR